MTKELTEKERNVLKYERRIGYVFSGIILSFTGFFNLFYFILNDANFAFLMIGIVNTCAICFAYLVSKRINLKINRDLIGNTKELLKRKVEEKIEEKSYEAGSGALFIPILGDLFPKIWGHKMNESIKYYILSNNYKYEVDIKTYNELKIGNDFFIHYAKHSGTILNFSIEK